MPSIVLLMRSRLRIRPFSFSMRMPSSSSYCRLILRRPASSFGRSSCPSSPCCSSSSRRLNPLLLVLLPAAFSVFRARAIRPKPSVSASARCSRSSSRTPRRSRAARSRRTGRRASRRHSVDSGGYVPPRRPSPRSSPSSPPCPPARLWLGAPGRGKLPAPGSAPPYMSAPQPCQDDGVTLRRQNSRASVDLSRHARPSAPAASDRRAPRPTPGRSAARRARHPARDRHGNPRRAPVDGRRRRRRERRDRDPRGHLRGRLMKCRRCGACGTTKRHARGAAAFAGGFDVPATGHNLDDEAARLLGNVLRWQKDHLARQRPVLPPSHPKFVRKVKPLYLTSEYETAVYAFMRGIDYIVDECPNAAGATQLLYKGALDRLEVASPGTKLAFVKEFLRSAQPAFAAVEQREPMECAGCGMPAYGVLCSFCSLVREVENRRAR